MENPEKFTARMTAQQDKAFAAFLAHPRMAAFMDKAPRPELAGFMRRMLEAAFNAGVAFTITQLISEIAGAERTEL